MYDLLTRKTATKCRCGNDALPRFPWPDDIVYSYVAR